MCFRWPGASRGRRASGPPATCASSGSTCRATSSTEAGHKERAVDLGLRDSVVFVGGSSRGIGLAVAEGFLAEGARVALSGRDPEALRRSGELLAARHGADRVTTAAGDLAAGDAARDNLAAVVGRWGALDVVVANAGS